MRDKYAGIDLSIWNPWWYDSEWYKKDPHLTAFTRSAVPWRPRLFILLYRRIFKKNLTGVVTVRGPRRVGKTTMIKMLIYALTREGVNPRRILYITCDDVELQSALSSGRPGVLRNILIEYYEDAVKNNVAKPFFIFIDESSLYRGWALEIKNIIDRGLVDENFLIYTTGSHSMDLAEASRLLKGRQGRAATAIPSGANQILYPMRFVEYVETLDRDFEKYMYSKYLMRIGTRYHMLKELTTIDSEISSVLYEIDSKYGGRLHGFLNRYLLTGGFAVSADAYIKDGVIPRSVYDDFYDLMVRDAEKFGLREFVLTTLLRWLSEHLSSQIDLHKEMKKTTRTLGFPHTIKISELERYLNYLIGTKSMLLMYEAKIAGHEPQIDFRTTPKVYFRDPFIYEVIYARTHEIADPLVYFKDKLLDPEFASRLVECVVASHLSVLPFLMAPSPLFEETRNIGYFRLEFGELDFVTWYRSTIRPGELNLVLIEVKYREHLRAEDLEPAREVAERYRRRVIILSKNDFRVESEVIIMPVHTFLILI
ncbi:MAG: hypothetical protein DRN53_02680 [Thermoprotei archaeon]|mgnify:FL=1|nr:MAG: hypothetical protein DRN53_02680 [Thermoprotei archaeon]